jgi:hypothetical protein
MIGLLLPSLLLAGCAQTPLGPTVQVMPGPGKPFDAFQADVGNCKGFAAQQVAGQAEAANQRAVGAAALTTILGAGLGAAIGGGRGAAIGAASGAGLGAGIGAQGSSMEQMNIQQQYDNAFSQCMYAKGDQVPGYAPMMAMAPPPGVYGPDPALVHAIQVQLVRLNYLNDTPDGVMGPRTSSAIRDFEQANALPVDGAPTQRLLGRLQSSAMAGGPVATPQPASLTVPAPPPSPSPAVTPIASAPGGSAPTDQMPGKTVSPKGSGWVDPPKDP